MRHPGTRFLPCSIPTRATRSSLPFRASSSAGARPSFPQKRSAHPDTMFREARDSSGDLASARQLGCAAAEADFQNVFERENSPSTAASSPGSSIGSSTTRSTGSVPIHRIIDRQNVGSRGRLDPANELSICLRKLAHAPRMRIDRTRRTPTVGLDKWAGLLPATMWGAVRCGVRYAVQQGRHLPGLVRPRVADPHGDRDQRRRGLPAPPGHAPVRAVHVGEDEIPRRSCIAPIGSTTPMRSNCGRGLQTARPTRRAHSWASARGPAADHVQPELWRDFRFDKSYERYRRRAEFGADLVSSTRLGARPGVQGDADPARAPEKQKGAPRWRSTSTRNMCCTFDFEWRSTWAAKRGSRRCATSGGRAGIKVLSWMARALHPHTRCRRSRWVTARLDLRRRESGRHPDTGYAASCWTVNFNAPVFEKIRSQILACASAQAWRGSSGFVLQPGWCRSTLQG